MTITGDSVDSPSLSEEISGIMEKVSRLECEIESMSDKMSSCQGGDESDHSTTPTGEQNGASEVKYESSPSISANQGQRDENSEISSDPSAGAEVKIRNKYTSSRDLLVRDEQYRTKLAIELEAPQADLENIDMLLKSGAASSVFVRDSRPQAILCTIPFARHPPDSEKLSTAGRTLAQNWRAFKGQKCHDEILKRLDKALADHIRKVSVSVRLHDTISSAQAQLKPDDNAAPSLVISSPASSKEDPKKNGEMFSAGDRIRLLPIQNSPSCLARLADWTWGPHDGSFVRISEAGMRAEGLGKSSSVSILGSKVFNNGRHSWEIQFQQIRGRTWVGIAAVDQSERCNFTSTPSDFGSPVVAFENDNDSYINMKGSQQSFRRSDFKVGQNIRLDVNVEQSLLQVFVDGILVRQISDISLKGTRPYVCLDGAGIVSLGAVLTSDLDFARSMHATNVSCLGQAEQGREGVVLDVKELKVGCSQKTLVKVASVADGIIGIFLSEALMLADCQSTGHISDPKISQNHTSSAAATACLTDIPSDWGTDVMLKVTVSSDSSGNGPAVLTDLDSQTYWQSNGQSGTHLIELELNWPMHIEEFGIIIDEIDDSYCPKRVRIFTTDLISNTQDLGSRSIPPGIKAGPKAIVLIRKSSTCVSAIKVLVEDSGGRDCRIRGVFVRGATFEFYDHVVLSDSAGIDSANLNLKKGATGIVVCTPYEAAGSCEQRGLIVASLLECRLNYYRASWLKHIDYESYVFKLGDMVELNHRTWETGNLWMESKCLGHPDQLKFGIVTQIGVRRGGIQRNIEVTTECIEDMQLLSRSHGKVLSSLYSARALNPASQFCNLTSQDKATLISAIGNIVEKAGESFHAPTLVELYGLRAWSKVWKWCAEKVSHSVVFAEFSAWMSSRPPMKPSVAPPLYKHVMSMAESESKDCKEGEANSGDSSWKCITCKTANDTKHFQCRICGSERESLPWACTNCSTICGEMALQCSFCYTQRPTMHQSELELLNVWFGNSTAETPRSLYFPVERPLLTLFQPFASIFQSPLSVLAKLGQDEESGKESTEEQGSDKSETAGNSDDSLIALSRMQRWTACITQPNTTEAKVDGLERQKWIYDAQIEADRKKMLLADGAAKIQPKKCMQGQNKPGGQGTQGAPIEQQDIDAEFELNENKSLVLGLPSPTVNSSTTRSSSRSLRHMVSFHMIRKQHYSPLEFLDGLIKWTDSYGSSAAHHAAFMNLKLSASALFDLGASRWIPNRGGETPAALMDGFSSLKEDGSPELSADDFELHSACSKGAFFDSFSDTMRISFIWKVITCPKNSPLSGKLADLHRDLFAKDSDTAAVLKTAKSLMSSNCHAHPYLAVAMLRQQYGVKAVSIELRKYLSSLSEKDWIDPMFFYAHYLMWVVQGRPRSGKERCSAVYGIHVFKRFQYYAKEFEFDDLDHHQSNHDAEGPALQAIAEDCETEDDDDAPGADDPETLWLRAKEHGGLKSDSMDKLMALTGLKSVKNSAARVVKEVLLQQNRPSKVDANVSMNFLFLGNPGCGKTTVAQLLAKSLHELGFRSNPKPLETSAQSILKLPNPVQEFVDMVQEAKGGTVFIDEAYRFSPNKGTGPPNDSNHILDFLLEVVETKEYRDTTTFILAGYKDEIDNLLAYNVGFSSRFSTEFNFEDFNEIQLKRIFLGMIKDRGMRLESRKECHVPLAKIVSRRIAQEAGKKGFGNARAVRNKLEKFIENQSHRLGMKKLAGGVISDRDYETLTRTDVIGPRPDYSQSLLIKQLDSMVGLKKVKDAVRKLVDLQLQNYDRELAGERRSLISLHRVFYGNPGTGKTTVVKIYGALLKELGLLSKGDFLQCTPADLMGTAVGGAAANTKSMLEKAKGKVLFIDEAYILDPKRGSNPYGGNVLDTLVEKLEGDAGSDIAVILAGYKQEMFDMLENNAGLRRRFNIDDFGIHFEDMSDDELRRVLIRSVNHAGLVLESDEVEDYVVNILTQKKRLPNFGNAGTVQSMLSTAKVNRAARISKAEKEYSEAAAKDKDTSFSRPNPDVLVKSDFDAEDQSNKKEDPFSKLYNIEHIQKNLEELEALIAAAKADKKDPAVILADCHMVFTGPPGTGKTTVARKFGELFKAQKLLPTDNVIVTSGTNLQGQYVGETKGKVIKLMQQARGGILLIDEAYGLNQTKGNWGYATEAVDTLVGQITEADFKGNLIVIMAGYANQVNEMFQSVNPGLRSRFDKKRIEFPPWTAAQAVDVAIKEIQKDGKDITEKASQELLTCFSEMTKDASWASARDVFETILPTMYSKRALRMAREMKKRNDDDKTVAVFEEALSRPYDVSDVREAFEHILGPRVPEIDTMAKLSSSLEETGKLIVVDYFATWCGPCKKFAPLFAGLKQEFKTVSFYRVDVDKCTEAGETYEIESIPTTLLYLNSEILMRISGADDRTLRKYLNEYIEKGFIESGPPGAQDGKGPSSNLKKGDQNSHSNEETSDGRYADGPGAHQSSMSTETETTKEVEYKGSDEVRRDDPDFAKKVQAALEEGCKELNYSLKAIAEMLRSSERYTKELINLIKSKTQCDDESKIRRALDPQKDQFLAKVEQLLLEMEKEKSEEQRRIQEKIKHMGKCPMDFEWIREDGGYRCAGGSHYLTDADLQNS